MVNRNNNSMSKSILINTEEIQQYIRDIRKIKVISHERQDEIFSELSRKDITKTEKQKLLNELVVGNLRFVITVAKIYQGQGMDMLDLISEGNIGLIKAAERFDPKSGFKFISYAVWWVKQSIMASLNENARMIRLPSNVIQENQKRQKSEPIPDDQFFINYEDTGAEIVLPHCVKLSDEINDEGDTLIDVIVNHDADNPEALLNTPEEVKKRVDMMLSILDDREKIIIEKSYGLTGIEMNLEDLGEQFGCTKERVRQLRDKALKKLRNDSYGLLNYL
jgi:RNA polymerase primary sigma factor